jgi:RHS repeat-associated protein
LFPIDSNGNLTAKTEGSDSWTYEWNARNELTRATKNSVEQARFSYDPLGRRVEKVASGITTGYAYDGANVLREVRGSTALKYVHGLGIDEPLAIDDGSALTYFHSDGLGSVVKATNASGAVNLTRQYDAWGNLEIGASEPGLSYTGRECDPEIGVYYYRARYYEPKIGRFISEDPLPVMQRRTEEVNAYGYEPTTLPLDRRRPGVWCRVSVAVVSGDWAVRTALDRSPANSAATSKSPATRWQGAGQ